ncbi:hypothetical protein CAS74_003250 [Pichia kudriavzevii]|uniref:Uncharacterized protein n=2 Tax=Pichia kudriavzevii TaxID=4909 RepID=A0A099P3I6_PICKU|nr:uncharacterized protein C5L36_0B01540 [Pichia kudriavzevii]AWU74889.1 hypothetical protein C5L36_0B01540 [Pichia kudriavzevii]KGK38839.1 hypothetical protein JL09_g2065 [Pichia kudriavzevii]OUT21136.1 hypothetical protein CAS74_003250 [Pichia kudriavzevii]
MNFGDNLTKLYERARTNDAVVLFNAFTNKYILRTLNKTEFTSHLVQSAPSRIVTVTLIYMGILLAAYEIVLHTGVFLGIWKNPADEVFKEIPVHCAHVYVNINLIKKEDARRKHDQSVKPKYLLKYPIVYHFEFSPEEYAHEEFGTDLKFLKGKVQQWFLTSEVYHHNKEEISEEITMDDFKFYNKHRELLVGDDKYLCDLDIGTGETVYCVIHY